MHANSIFKPLQLIFRSCTESEKLLSEQEKATDIPVHKRDNKRILEN